MKGNLLERYRSVFIRVIEFLQIIGDVVDAQAKLDSVKKHAQLLGIELSQVIGIGDGANDLVFLKEV